MLYCPKYLQRGLAGWSPRQPLKMAQPTPSSLSKSPCLGRDLLSLALSLLRGADGIQQVQSRGFLGLSHQHLPGQVLYFPGAPLLLWPPPHDEIFIRLVSTAAVYPRLLGDFVKNAQEWGGHGTRPSATLAHSIVPHYSELPLAPAV